MLTVSEIVRSVYGVWRLAGFDAIGMEWLDRSAEGFWRSFRVAILLAPVEIVTMAIHLTAIPNIEPFAFILITATIAYVISWTVYPVLSHPLIAALGRSERYAGYITAINWSQVLLSAVVLALTLLDFVMPAVVTDLFRLAFFIGWGVYHWFITRTALDLDIGPSIGLTLMEMVLIITTAQVTMSMIIAAPPAAG